MTDFLKLPEGYGPASAEPPDDGFAPARWLRSLTGVEESLLAWIWHERGKYTALGGVVLGTSVIAGFSMWNFANQAIGRASVLSLLPALIWMLFVLNLDRWLIAPSPGGGRRLGPLITRLMVAVVLGIVVAEPLVLRIFQSAVEEHVQNERNDTVDALRSNLLRCNPDPSRADSRPPADCGPHLLSFDSTPGSLSTELATLRDDAASLQQRVDGDNERLEELNTQVRDECDVLIRNASTGLYERTSECYRLRDVVEDYRETHHTEENQERLADLTDRIAEIEGALSTSRDDYLAARDAAIEERLEQERAQQREIGVLERIGALDELASRDGVLQVGVWLVRLLFVFIDILPVLVKFLAGASNYDRLLAARSNAAFRVHEDALRTTERQEMAKLEIARARIDQDLLRDKAELEADRREHVAAMNIRVRQAVDSLENELRRVSAP